MTALSKCLIDNTTFTTASYLTDATKKVHARTRSLEQLSMAFDLLWVLQTSAPLKRVLHRTCYGG